MYRIHCIFFLAVGDMPVQTEIIKLFHYLNIDELFYNQSMDDEQRGLFIIAFTILSFYIFLIYLCSTWLQKRYQWSTTIFRYFLFFWILFLLIPIVNIFAVLAILIVAIMALWAGPPIKYIN